MSKNCYPAIKNNIIQFLSDVKYENYDTELPNIEIHIIILKILI